MGFGAVELSTDEMFGDERSNEALTTMVRVPGKYRRRVPFKKPLSLFQVIRQGKNKEDQADRFGKIQDEAEEAKNPSFQLRGWISDDDIRFSYHEE
jgi:hypothetical protein